MRSCFVYQLECRRKHTHIFWFNSFCYSLVLSRRKKRQTQRARVRMKEGKPNFDSIRSVRHVSIRVFNILRNQWSPFVFCFSFLPNSEEKIETREKKLAENVLNLAYTHQWKKQRSAWKWNANCDVEAGDAEQTASVRSPSLSIRCVQLHEHFSTWICNFFLHIFLSLIPLYYITRAYIFH